MLKSCLPYLASSHCTQNSTTMCFEEPPSLSPDNFSVRLVHAGGKVDHFPEAVLASVLLQKLPGKWLARPQVFEQPHESLIAPEEYLIPGHKYYVIPLSTVRKLKRKHMKMKKHKREKAGLEFEAAVAEMAPEEEEEDECMEESFCSAKDFYVSNKITWSRSSFSVKKRSKGVSRARSLPPLPTCRGPSWEPALSSIQEVSP